MRTLNGKGRTALVTGARRGIGLGIAKALLEDGYRVMLCSVTRGEDAVKDIAADLDKLGDWCYVPCDVSDEAERAALFEEVRKQFGGRLDVLVNNAGVAPKVRIAHARGAGRSLIARRFTLPGSWGRYLRRAD